MKEYTVGKKWKHEFSFNQQQVIEFSKITGDVNPIHLDDEYAKNTIFKRKIVHGALTTSVFSKVFGTFIPGEGAIYLHQSSSFLKPMFINTKYEALFEIININKNKIEITTQIQDISTQEYTVEGKAILLITNINYEKD